QVRVLLGEPFIGCAYCAAVFISREPLNKSGMVTAMTGLAFLVIIPIGAATGLMVGLFRYSRLGAVAGHALFITSGRTFQRHRMVFMKKSG
ncbi:MAG: hypothetical protein Q9M29_05770, partial [Mariprofundaceae bacterium]|nr:hypothetical protein [Mariprofundaceae bacterium]